MARSGTSRPGGRTAVTRARVHAAVRELLSERPTETPQMAQIAARSGVNAATLYRRWGTLEALVLEVVVDDLTERSPTIATGDLRTDLLAYARQVQTGMSKPEGLHLLRAVAATTTTPEGGLVAQELVQRRLDELSDLVAGFPDEALNALDVVNGIIAPITYRRLLTPDLPLDGSELARLVDTLLAGAAARRTPSHD